MLKRIAEKFNRFIEKEEAKRREAALLFASDFLNAVEKNEKETVDFFFKQKGVSAHQRLAQVGMCVAAEHGLSDMVDHLLAKGVAADSLYNAFGRKTAIDIARENGHDAIADKLQKASSAKAKPNTAPKAP